MKELTKRQQSTMKKHKKHHSAKHLNLMVAEMMRGKSFSEAHKIAQKKVGK